MREIVLKNLISDDKRRREIFVSERTQKEDIIQQMEKRSVYVIKDALEVTQDFDLKLFLQQKKAEGHFKPQQTFIIKIRDSQDGKEKFIYKVMGDQYLILENRLFLLGATQYLKIEINRNLAAI